MTAPAATMEPHANAPAARERSGAGHLEVSQMPEAEYKRCAACDESKPTVEFHRNRTKKDGLATQCKKCAIARANKWQRDNPARHAENDKRSRQSRPDLFSARLGRYKEKYPDKARAHKAVLDAVYTGRLVKPAACEDCGEATEKSKLDGHHKDYAAKLDVEWLCRRCHGRLHLDQG